jgi:acetyl esterase
MTGTQAGAQASTLPGRLGHPDYELRTDPRSDPRMVATLAVFGLDGLVAPAPVSSADPLSARLEYITQAESGFEQVFAGLFAGLPPVPGIDHRTETITGVDGNKIALYIHRPQAESPAPRPGVLHLHGGGMTLLGAAGPAFVRWRDDLAATGMVVIGVEFRNAGGVHGAHPFPAGLADCSSTLEWVHAHRDRLGISTLTVSGESGGGNLSLATTIKAKRDGRLDMIDGVYAMVPFISGAYGWSAEQKAAELPSLLENDGYFIDCSGLEIIRSVYDVDDAHGRDPLCWPYWAGEEDLTGLPPHVITVSELDPLRDEGLAYHRKLARAGVDVTGRTVTGVCHAGEGVFPKTMPNLYLSTVHDIRSFAQRIHPHPQPTP